MLTGCIFSALKWRQSKHETFFWINTGAILLWGGCVFGWIPASVIAAIPWLNRVGHTYSDFSYLLVILLTIQSAYGFKGLAREENLRKLAVDFLWVVLIFEAIILENRFRLLHRPIPLNYFLCAGAGAVGAPLLFAFLKNRYRQIPVIGWTGIILLGFAAQFRFGLYSFGNNNLLMLSGPRMALNASSKAIDHINADKTGPFRVVPWQQSSGKDYSAILNGDYSAVYGLEDIRSCGPVSSGEYIKLIQHFPGMKIENDWLIGVVDPVAGQPLLFLNNLLIICIQKSISNCYFASFV